MLVASPWWPLHGGLVFCGIVKSHQLTTDWCLGCLFGDLGQKNEIFLVHVSGLCYSLDSFTYLKETIMLKNVVAWVKAHQTTRMDSRAFMACMFDLGVSSADEAMFRAAWNLATMPGQAGAATVAVVETITLTQVSVADSFVSHMTAFAAARAELAAIERAASAARHDMRVGYMYFQPVPVDARAFERANYYRFA